MMMGMTAKDMTILHTMIIWLYQTLSVCDGPEYSVL